MFCCTPNGHEINGRFYRQVLIEFPNFTKKYQRNKILLLSYGNPVTCICDGTSHKKTQPWWLGGRVYDHIKECFVTLLKVLQISRERWSVS